MKLAIGCDKNAVDLKEKIINFLQEEKNITVEDVGVSDSEDDTYYPEVAKRVVDKIRNNDDIEQGILICGTGIGMALTANKFAGIYAAKCHDIYSAERAKKSNDTNVLTMGAQVINYKLAIKLVDIWVESEFSGGRSAPKVELIREYEAAEQAG